MVAKGGLGRSLWDAVLSLLIPGLGQVHARAWRSGLRLLGIWLAFIVTVRVLLRTPPNAASLLAVLSVGLAGMAFHLWAAVSVFRHTRAYGARPLVTWWQSTWTVGITCLCLGGGMALAMPARWSDFYTSSGSGIPGILVGDWMIADTSPFDGLPARGEMVLFRMPRAAGSIWVKRLIGLPGDRVQMKAGRLYLNGAEVARVALGAFSGRDVDHALHARRYRETLPGGRSYDIIKEYDDGELDDTAEFVVPPGRFFMLGDNRDNSADSRLGRIGTVPLADIIGRPVLNYWSRDHGRILSRVR
jgi:signal peptidase I